MGIGLLEGERLLRFAFVPGTGPERRLVLELYGSGGNIVLLDEGDRVLGRSGPARRPGSAAAHGQRWTGPGGAGHWMPLMGPEAPGSERISAQEPEHGLTEPGEHVDRGPRDAEVGVLYALREAETSAAATLERGIRNASRRVRELERLVDGRERDLRSLGDPTALRERADLLRGGFSLLRRGMDSVVVTDWGAEGLPLISLALDPALAPADQVDRAYSKARRAERARIEGSARLAAARNSLGEARAELARAERGEPCAPDEAEAAAPPPLAPTATPRSPARPQARSPFVAFLAPNGLELRAGRGGADNDQLTFKHSRGNDLWLHVRGRPGAHVVVRSPGPSPSPELLQLAAQLAMARSGVGDGDRAEVAWTRVKHVTKKKGMKPGAVLITQEKVLYLDHARSAIAALRQL